MIIIAVDGEDRTLSRLTQPDSRAPELGELFRLYAWQHLEFFHLQTLSFRRKSMGTTPTTNN